MSGTAPQPFQPDSPREVGGMPKPGDLVADRYRIDAIVGEGGMGIVAKATHLELGSHVAIKFLNPEALERRDGLQRFAQEARTIANLKSQHVVKVFDVNSRAARPYMVMELLDGQDLDSGVSKGVLPPVVDVIRYFRQACDALIEAHGAGVIHRDLKPANLFLTQLPSGLRIVKILDFGIAKVFQSEESAPTGAKLTGMREVFGSPAYMSPEQITSASSVDARSDIWSLGVSFYEILTCNQPFVGEFPDIFLSIATREPVPMATYRPDVPPALEQIILRCLRKTRADRYQSMIDVDEALALLEREISPVELAAASLREPMRARAASVPESGVMRPRSGSMPDSPRPEAVLAPPVVLEETSHAIATPAAEPSRRTLEMSKPRTSTTLHIADEEPIEVPTKSRTSVILVALVALLLVGGGLFAVSKLGAAKKPEGNDPKELATATATIPPPTATASATATPEATVAPPNGTAVPTGTAKGPLVPVATAKGPAVPTAATQTAATVATAATTAPTANVAPTSTAGDKTNDPFGGGRK